VSELLVTKNNYQQLLTDIDFTLVDILKFKGMSGYTLGNFLFDVVSQCVFAKNSSPPSTRFGREFKYIQHEEIVLGFRSTVTTTYSYLRPTSRVPSLRGLPSNNGFIKVEQTFDLKQFITMYRGILKEQQEKRQAKLLQEHQDSVERITLSGILSEMGIPENNIIPTTSNVVSAFVCERGYYTKYIHTKFVDFENDIFDVHLPELNNLIMTKEQLATVLNALKPFIQLKETK
jgi:hypothetical protein